MRVSVDKLDKGFANYLLGHRAFLDGRDMTEIAVTADEELGEIHVYQLNGAGNPYYDPELDKLPMKILKGKVTIVLDNR